MSQVCNFRPSPRGAGGPPREKARVRRSTARSLLETADIGAGELGLRPRSVPPSPSFSNLSSMWTPFWWLLPPPGRRTFLYLFHPQKRTGFRGG
jgi:hypothetical protein